MVIQHNNPAFISWRHGNGNKHKLARTLEKLSSGLRINRAADDAAGLAVSKKLRAQVTGLTQAHINSNNGISVVQTAEGALEEDHQIFRRMTDLAVESANGIFTEGDRAKLDGEYQALLEELVS